MNISGIMEELKERSWFTIDERLSIHQARLDLCLEELKSNLTDDDRLIFEAYKAEEEHKIYLLNSKKEKLLDRPSFLLLIANVINNKVFKTIPTYIEHADEAKYFSKETIEKLLVNNDIHFDLGCYIGIIVRKAFYEKMSAIDKNEVQRIFADNNVYVTSREITITVDNVSVI